MLSFKAEDGYSYLIEISKDSILKNTYRMDSEEVKITLGTNETVKIVRLDISPGTSTKLSHIRKNMSDIYEV